MKWRAEHHNGTQTGPFWGIWDGNDRIATCDATGPLDEDRARLIAAAPALLEACRAMIRSHAPTINGLCKICHHYGDDCEANLARAAIAAATRQ